MTRYAAETSVSVEKSRAEIESVLGRYGACAFGYMSTNTRAVVMFEASGRRIQFTLPLPDRADKAFWFTPGRNTKRTPDDAYRQWEQACRQRWRALALAIKAKLEAVACGITTFEEEFLAHIVLPDGGTVGAWMIPQVAQAYETRQMPPLLGMGSSE